MPVLLALASNPFGGKSKFTSELRSRGFASVSGSEILEASAAIEGVELGPRSDYDKYHRLWRRARRPDAMGAYVLDVYSNLPEPKRFLFENLRNKYDAETIRRGGGFIVALECPFDLRLQRALMSDRKELVQPILDVYHEEGNRITERVKQIFHDEESPEYDSPDDFGSHVIAVMDSAHIKLDSSKPSEVIADELYLRLSTDFGVQI